MTHETASVYDDVRPLQPDAFAYVRVHVDYHLNHLVEWRLKDSVTDRYGTFEVETLVGDVVRSVSARVDGLFTQIPLPAGNRGPVRVRVRYKGLYGEYLSREVPAVPQVSNQDRGLASQMLSRQAITLRRYSGTRGLLLKQRLTGNPCPVCVDTTLGAPGLHSCASCHGTGLKDGYYPGVELYLEMRAPANPIVIADLSIGAMEPANVIQAICAHEHWIEKGDLWVNSLTGDRYTLQEFAPLSSFKDLIISYQLTLRKEGLSSAGGKGTAINDRLPSRVPIAFE